MLGRDEDLKPLRELRSAGERLITITGAGGIGKTTLARASAERVDVAVFCVRPHVPKREPLGMPVQMPRVNVVTAIVDTLKDGEMESLELAQNRELLRELELRLKHLARVTDDQRRRVEQLVAAMVAERGAACMGSDEPN